ncbi:MAG: polymer-forming cytoskeletal protein [Chloroflexi bacterium]|nr:polymer-forming cytoskeletal protein [Chloroflexota bacterium]
MKPFTKVILLLTLLAALAFPGVALADSPREDKIIFGDSYTLPAGDTLNGNLVVLGGSANLEKNSLVQGDILLMGGSLTIDGEVTGNVSTMGGSVFLQDNAHVRGNVTTLAASLHRSDKARVDGEVVIGSNKPFQFNVPNNIFIPDLRFGFPFSNLFWSAGSVVAQSLGLAALAILAALFLSRQAERTARAIMAQPVAAGGFGCLTAIVAPLLIVIVSITIILIPIGLLASLALGLAVLFGWIAVGFEVGNRLAKALNQNWPLALSAGLGTFLMTLVVNSVGYIPCVGWLIPFLVGLLGLGGVILTRFGTQNYPPYNLQAYPTAPVPPAAPAPPTAPETLPPTPPAEG